MVYITILVILLGYWYGLSLFFKKAGKTSWHAFVPYYRIKALTEIFKKDKLKWIIMSFIPVVNLFVYSNLLGEISNSIRKFDFWEHTLAVVFGWVWLPVILNNDKIKFIGIGGVPEGEQAPKVTRLREWSDAILFAIFAAYFIRSFVFEIYTIPTSSMEGTLKVGDFLIVSKFTYGARIPITPIAFPLVHHSFPKDILGIPLPIIGGKKSYLEWIKLPYKRLLKIKDIKRNDMVVFNFPANDTTTTEYDSAYPYYDMLRDAEKQGIQNPREYIANEFTVITRPVDKRENYIKRCVGIAGDKLQVKDGLLYINNELAYESEFTQYTYIVKGKGQISYNGAVDKTLKNKLLDLGIIDFDGTSMNNVIKVYTNTKIALKVQELSEIISVEKYIHNSEKEFADKKRMYPNTDKAFRNNVDNYGPIIIPSKGMTVELNRNNFLLYSRVIRVYEGNSLEIKNGKAYLNGEETTEYTFKMNYYWMMGDNRHRSQDSRYWGFVPENHVVGKAWMLIASMGKHDGFRWDRVFRLIHKSWAPTEKKYTD